jgi:hypothetical protein
MKNVKRLEKYADYPSKSAEERLCSQMFWCLSVLVE